ncbi:MAG: beta-glucanase, partial [Bacteroidia bacterium]|nr:beta-glucanase [Bacteroidia bacterium]
MLFVLFSCSTNQQIMTIKPGDVWKDNRGVPINAHGGGILYHKGVYYWYGEHKDEHTNVANVGINCYSSHDLSNWKFEGVVLPVVTNDDSSDIAMGCVMERPKVVYNEKTKKFVLWFHLELK